MITEGIDRRFLGFTQRDKSTGQHHRDRAAVSQGFDARLRRVFKMIGRQRVEAGGKFGVGTSSGCRELGGSLELAI